MIFKVHLNILHILKGVIRIFKYLNYEKCNFKFTKCKNARRDFHTSHLKPTHSYYWKMTYWKKLNVFENSRIKAVLYW